ncbi:hypothetical protein F4861DRAFT_547875, partial [Xylaria intraflava]
RNLSCRRRRRRRSPTPFRSSNHDHHLPPPPFSLHIHPDKQKSSFLANLHVTLTIQISITMSLTNSPVCDGCGVLTPSTRTTVSCRAGRGGRFDPGCKNAQHRIVVEARQDPHAPVDCRHCLAGDVLPVEDNLVGMRLIRFYFIRSVLTAMFSPPRDRFPRSDYIHGSTHVTIRVIEYLD